MQQITKGYCARADTKVGKPLQAARSFSQRFTPSKRCEGTRAAPLSISGFLITGESGCHWRQRSPLVKFTYRLDGGHVIYCVVPSELGEDAYRRLVEHYKDNPNITVMMDRRHGDRRHGGSGGGERERRDRRRPRSPGRLSV